ncbi:MAG: leucine-rich repeat domain-containing protein [Bacillota bacterium]|nr:leucine-rich repeat domain-containing protein [Bacillota bacterium]
MRKSSVVLLPFGLLLLGCANSSSSSSSGYDPNLYEFDSGSLSYNVVSEGKVGVIGFSKKWDGNGDIEIPEMAEGYSVIAVLESAFEESDGLKKITLSDSISYIEQNAFYDCVLLQEVDLGDGLSEVGDFAFAGVTLLESIELPSSLISLGEGCFANADSLDAIILPRSVTTIGPKAFESDAQLTIYCEASQVPSGWDSSWNLDGGTAYFYSETQTDGYWHYDSSGNPVLW